MLASALTRSSLPFPEATDDRSSVAPGHHYCFLRDPVEGFNRDFHELHHGLPLRIALEQVREVYAEVPEVSELVTFIEGSTRGICRSAGTEPSLNG